MREGSSHFDTSLAKHHISLLLCALHQRHCQDSAKIVIFRCCQGGDGSCKMPQRIISKVACTGKSNDEGMLRQTSSVVHAVQDTVEQYAELLCFPTKSSDIA